MKRLWILWLLLLVPTAQALEVSDEPLFTFGRGVITHLDYSPDGKYLAVSSPYSIELLETDGYTLIASWEANSYEAVFSPDGKTLASRTDSGLELFEVPSGKGTRLTNAPSPGMAFRPDGRLMAWFNGGRELQIWNIETHQLEERNTYDMGGNVFRYSPNREYVATGFGWNTYAKVLHLPTGKIQVIDAEPLGVDVLDTLALTDEYLFAFHATVWPQPLLKYDFTSREMEAIAVDVNDTRHLAVSADGRYLAINDQGRGTPTVFFWDMKAGRSRSLVGTGTQGRTHSYFYMTFSPDGQHLALSLGDRLLTWNVSQLSGFGGSLAKEVIAVEGHLMPVYALSFGENGRLLASAGNAGTLSIWDTQTGTLFYENVRNDWDYRSVQLLAGGKEVALGRHAIIFVDLDNGNEDSHSLGGHCQSMSLSPDGKVLAGSITGSRTGNDGVYLWNTQTHQLLDKLVHERATWAVAFHPDGRLLAAGDDGAAIKIWDWQNKQVIQELHGHTAAIRSLSFSSDGSLMVSSGDDGLAFVWDTQTWSEVARLSFNGSKAVINPQGNLIAMARNNGGVRLNEGGWTIETPWSHRGNVNAIVFSPDGSLLASGSSDGTVKLWAIPTGENKLPVVKLTSKFAGWQSGALRLTAEASDPDGEVESVSFQYSTGGNLWLAIGEDKSAPYEVIWDTSKALPIGAETVWLRAVARDNQGGIATASSTESFGIANVGTPSGGMHAFTMSLDEGLHNLSLPLRPETSYTARGFAEILRASLVVQYDEDADRFSTYIPAVATIEGFPIQGGHGYIVNLPEAKEVTFTGTAWSAAPAKPRANSTESLWAFAVGGLLPQGIEAERLTLLNPRNGWRARAESQGAGRFGVVLVGAEGDSVVALGDTLEIYQDERVIAGHCVTASELRLAYGIVTLTELLPSRTRLLANYPNPFNPETWIPYQLAGSADVTIRIYDLQGRLVRKLALGRQPAGVYVDKAHAMYWDGTNAEGESVSSGVYFYQLDTGNRSTIRRMAVVK